MATTSVGVAIAVAMVATLFGFFAATESSMTRQAIADVAVDWQVQLAPGFNPQVAIDELTRSPGAAKIAQVGFANTPGFEATTGSTTQTTGPGKVLGLQAGYRGSFPAEIRDLVGQGQVLIAQQTAANLHAAPGTTITIKRPGLDPVQVQVDEVVDLPMADSLFQIVGAPAGTAPQAPPDNVLILPIEQWHAFFDPVAVVSPDAVTVQLHVTLFHDFPSAPTAAYTRVSRMARNLETRLAGSGLVGDNLSARLDVARSDALYARLLFLFLGLPGAILAGLLTAAIVASGAGQRRRDQALLRLRGATTGQVLQLAALEAVCIGLIGSLVGLAGAFLSVRLTFGRWTFGNGVAASVGCGAVAASAGIVVAVALILHSAWRNARSEAVSAARRTVGRGKKAWWERLGLDFILIALSALVYWQMKRGGYQVVLAPEGAPRVSVSYTSLVAPLLLWAGVALLASRLTRVLLSGNGRRVAPLMTPIAGRLSGLVSASLGRQSSRVAIGLVFVGLAIAFAMSTAIFNATYEHQSLVDAELTNGADVTVTGSQSVDLGQYRDQIAKLPGVAAVQPMQHRFAYVGADLQDIYGIDPLKISDAARLSDAFFPGQSAQTTMAALAATPDGVLVSSETVSDFQLQPGDSIKLRLQNASDGRYHPVPFRYIGIAREFPTAPSDSFLVANAAYISQVTGTANTETLLVRTSDSPAGMADQIRGLLGVTSGATVRDIEAQRRVTRSSLTAVSLHGLTRLELGYAVLVAAAGSAFVLALGMDERRRTLAIATALGSTSRQIGAFVWGETLLILIGGVATGLVLGWSISHMLIKLLTHVFDPPPQGDTVPWAYLVLVIAVAVVSTVAASWVTIRAGRRNVLEAIRAL